MCASYTKYELIRDKRGLKDSQVANLANIPRQSISGWKLGQYKPKISSLTKIADVLGCSIEDLLEKGD